MKRLLALIWAWAVLAVCALLGGVLSIHWEG